VQYYEEKDVARLLTMLENEPLIQKTIVFLAIDTGLRSGELCGLT